MKALYTKDNQAYFDQNKLKPINTFKIDTPKQVWSITCDEFNQQKVIISGHEDGSINLWDMDKGTHIAELKKIHTEAVRSLTSVTIKGKKFLASGSYDNLIIIWNLDTKDLCFKLDKHTDYVRSLLTLTIENKEYLASASSDKTIIIWDLESKTQFHILKYTTYIYCITLVRSKGIQCIASGSHDGLVILWDFNTEQIISKLEQKHSDTIWALTTVMIQDR